MPHAATATPTPSDDLAQAFSRVAGPMLAELLERLQAQQQTAVLELVGQLKPGKNVRVLPADEVKFETTNVRTGGATILASEALDRVLLVLEVDEGDTIYLTSRAGAEATASDTIAVVGPTRLELPVRGVVYAVATVATEVRVTTYSADY